MTVLNHADAIYLGSRKVDKIMLGAVQVWPTDAPPPGVSLGNYSTAQGQTNAGGATWANATALEWSHTVAAGTGKLIVVAHSFTPQGSNVSFNELLEVGGVAITPLDVYAGPYVQSHLVVYVVDAPAAGATAMSLKMRHANSSNYGRITGVAAIAVDVLNAGALDVAVVTGTGSSFEDAGVSTPVLQFFATEAVNALGFSGYSQTQLVTVPYDTAAAVSADLYAGSALSGGPVSFEASGVSSVRWYSLIVELDA